MSDFRRTSQENHVEVISRHEVDVHLRPNAGRVDIPADETGFSLGEDVAWTGTGRVGIGSNINDSGSQKGQKLGYDCEHPGRDDRTSEQRMSGQKATMYR